MAVSELSDHGSLELRLRELEHREAGIESDLAQLLARGRPADSATEERIAALRRDHLHVRRELNTVRARLVPILAR